VSTPYLNYTAHALEGERQHVTHMLIKYSNVTPKQKNQPQ